MDMLSIAGGEPCFHRDGQPPLAMGSRFARPDPPGQRTPACWPPTWRVSICAPTTPPSSPTATTSWPYKATAASNWHGGSWWRVWRCCEAGDCCVANAYGENVLLALVQQARAAMQIGVDAANFEPANRVERSRMQDLALNLDVAEFTACDRQGDGVRRWRKETDNVSAEFEPGDGKVNGKR